MKKTLSKLWASVSLVAIACAMLTTNSCKKENNDVENFISQARAWYASPKKTSVAVLQSNKGYGISILQEPIWNQAKVHQLNNGTEVVSMPLKASASDSAKLEGSLALLIYKINDDFKSKVVYSKEKSYNAPIESTDLQRLFERSFKREGLPTNTAVSSGTKGKLAYMQQPRGENCVDWYYLTTYYDEDGNFLYDDVEYAYTVCDFSNTGGGGVGGEAPASCADLATALETSNVSVLESESSTDISAIRKKKIYQWMFLKHRFGTWNFVSTETGYWKKVNG